MPRNYIGRSVGIYVYNITFILHMFVVSHLRTTPVAHDGLVRTDAQGEAQGKALQTSAQSPGLFTPCLQPPGDVMRPQTDPS